MKEILNNNHRGILLFVCILILLPIQFVLGQNKFPYFNSGQTNSGFKILGESTNDKPSPGLITFTKDGIKLVDNYSQYAGVSLDNLDFTTGKGFILDFEFGMDKGAAAPRYGDGIAMVLYDATDVNPVMGVKGGGLGYAHVRNNASGGKPGFSKGFLGLGLDLYGNFKNRMTNTDEIRNGITNNEEGDYIVLRGPYNSTVPLEGYPVLFAVNTKSNNNYYLNRVSGLVESMPKGIQGQRFDIRSGKGNVGVGDPGYRKAIISLIPGIDDVAGEEGFFISVDILNGIYKSVVVNNYFIPKKGKIKYTEQLGASSAAVREMDIVVPSSLKMAFTGSTGGAAIRAYIRNIALSLPFSPVANDMTVSNVLIGATTIIKPLYSAYGHNSNVYSILNPPIRSVQYLDKKTFRFKRMNPTTQQLELTTNPYFLEEAGIGVFRYDVNTGEVSFTSEEGLLGDVPYIFYYDIKNIKPKIGEDISTEEYRSRVAAVTLTFLKKGEGIDSYPSMIVNKGIKNTKK